MTNLQPKETTLLREDSKVSIESREMSQGALELRLFVNSKPLGKEEVVALLKDGLKFRTLVQARLINQEIEKRASELLAVQESRSGT